MTTSRIARTTVVTLGLLFAAVGVAWAAIDQPQPAIASADVPHASPTAILEVVIDAVDEATPDALEAATEAASRERGAVRAMPGCVETTVAVLRASGEGGQAASMRATVWTGVERVEDASLAMDGGGAATSQRTRAYFRLLREQRLSDEPTGHLEVVIFRTKPGVTRDANVELFDKGEADYAELGKGEGGLIAHSLWIAPDGRWVHLLHWRSETDYKRTGKALFARPGVGGWIRSLDFKRFTVYRGDTIAQPAAPSDGSRE